MRTAVMTDTNSGLTMSEGRNIGVTVIPMPVIVGGRCYREGVDITHAELYEQLHRGTPVSTSQPAPADLTEAWDALLQRCDQVIYLPMSAGLSSSCQTALLLAEEYGGRVHVADNRRISVTQYAAVLDALDMAKDGMTALEIKRALEQASCHGGIYVAVNTLSLLKKSGRVTAAGAALAAVLDVKPVLSIGEGKLDAAQKVRGMKQARRRMVELVQGDIAARLPDVPPDRLRIGTAGTYLSAQDEKDWIREVGAAFKGAELFGQRLSCSVACHVGPGAYGIGYSVIE